MAVQEDERLATSFQLLEAKQHDERDEAIVCDEDDTLVPLSSFLSHASPWSCAKKMPPKFVLGSTFVVL